MGRRKGDGDTASSVRGRRLFCPLFFVPRGGDERSQVTGHELGLTGQLENLVQNCSCSSSRRKHEVLLLEARDGALDIRHQQGISKASAPES